jgi:type VI secretion system secreted protein VgrG
LFSSNSLIASLACSAGLDVRHFRVTQGMSALFRIELLVVSGDGDIDFDEVVGREGSFTVSTSTAQHAWFGVCTEMELLRTDSRGLSTYRVHLAPRWWLATQRKNFRVFQYLSELEIVCQLLDEWGVEYEVRLDPATHPGRKFRVQYGETDYDFACRMLEDAGISFYFEATGDESRLVLSDAPHHAEPGVAPVPFRDRPEVTEGDFVTRVEVRSALRPGAMLIGDLDYRKPADAQPRLGTVAGRPQEARLEVFEYEPGAFLYQDRGSSASTSAADDRGNARTNEARGLRKVQDRLLSSRAGARRIELATNLIHLSPGDALTIVGHPHALLASARPVLVTDTQLEGAHDEAWALAVGAVPTDEPYRGVRTAVQPVVKGLVSATVVGPVGGEIHCDEMGRIRVQFPWDREGERDEKSSCWIPTSQPWAGDGTGSVNLPRVGQEVLVQFLGGNPDRPVVTGRVFTETNPVPLPLPALNFVSGFMSESSPRLVMGASGGADAARRQGQISEAVPFTDAEIASYATQAGPHQTPSPGGNAHEWQGTGMLLSDQNGRENLYLQTNRDMHWVVRNNWTSVVGNSRSAVIGTDDITEVRGDQFCSIGSDQLTIVQRSQRVSVGRDRTDIVGQRFTQTVRESLVVESKHESMQITAHQNVRIKAGTALKLSVQNSEVTIDERAIVALAGESRIHLNPLATAAELERRRQAAQAAAAEQAYQDFRMVAQSTPGMIAGRGEETSARQWMRDRGITDRATQDQMIDRYYRRGSLDSQ